MVTSRTISLILTVEVVCCLVTRDASALSIGVILDKTAAADVTNMTSLYYWHLYYPQVQDISLKWVVLNSSSPRQASKTVCQMINQGIRALVTVLRCPQRRAVSTMTDAFQIPHLTTELDPCRPSGEFTLHLPTLQENLATVLVDVILSIAWKRVYLEFSHGFEPVTKRRFIGQLSLAGIKTVMKSSSEEKQTLPGTLLTMRHKMKRDGEGYYSLAGHYDTKVVFTYDLTPQKYRNLRTLNDVNILFVSVRPVPHTPLPDCCLSPHLTTIVDCEVAKAVWMLRNVLSSTVIEQVNQTRRNMCSSTELKTFPEGNGVLNKLGTIHKESGKCGLWNKVTEYDLYTVPAGPGSRLLHAGEWSEAGGLNLHAVGASLTHIVLDFAGATLRAAVAGTTGPFVRRTSSGSKPFQGVCIDMLDELAKRHNFRYVFEDVPGGQFGSKLNGSWTGVIGMIARQEADIGVNAFTMDVERLEVVDFTTPFMQDSLGIMTPHPKEAYELFQVFKPFSPTIWFYIVTAIACACVIFVVISWANPARSCREKNFPATIYVLISSFCEQGPTFHPCSASARCFLTFWCVYSILIMTIYTANLAADLTVSSPLKPINTLTDLAAQKDMEIRVLKGSSVWDVSENFTQPLYQKIDSRFVYFDNVGDLFQIVPGTPFCAITDRSLLEYVAAESCGMWRVAEEKFHEFSQAFIVGKNSPYKAALDHSIQVMVESGFIDHLKQKWFRNPLHCPSDNSSKVCSGLNMERLGGVFAVYGVASLAAFITLLLEFIITWCIGIYMVYLAKRRQIILTH